jgi:RNA polymerase sigma-70 factor, ECF subfamily
MFVVVDSLEPAQRIAFVLHDVFAVPFDEIAEILGRSVVATRQLASRARATVRAARPGVGAHSDRAVVDAFLAAAREGDLATLMEVLDPDVVCRADAGAAAMGSPSLAGRDAVAQFFHGAAKSARRAVVDGAAGLFWAMGGEVKVVFEFTVVDDRVVAIDFLGTPEVLEAAEIRPLTSHE